MLSFIADLFVERVRVWLTILAIAWGTVSISIMLALGEGLRQTFGRSTEELGTGLVVIWPGMSSKAYRGQPPQAIQFMPQDVQRLQALPHVSEVLPEYGQSNIAMRYQNNHYQADVVGVEPNYASPRNLSVQTPGRFIDDLDDARPVIVIGEQIAKSLQLTRANLGQTLYVDELPFTLIGILQPKKQIFSYGHNDNTLGLVPVKVFRSVWQDAISNLLVRVKPGTQPKNLEQRIRQALVLPRGLSATDPGSIHVMNTAEMQQKIAGFMLGMEIFLGLIGLLTLIVAGVGIANIMFATVSSATREIGIRKAIGARQGQILSYYIYQSLAVTAMGGTLGIAMSMALVAIFNHLPMPASMLKNLGELHLSLSSLILLSIVAVLGGVGLLAGLFPARRAARVDPVIALRSI